MPDSIYGPLGALVVLSVVVTALSKVVKVLWDDHQRADRDDRAEVRKDRDDWKNLAITAQAGQARLTKVLEDKLDIKVPPP